ncbi:hypothetical protein CLAFUW4_10925 [Fulvia fulva]|uniref:F-box domain-containing protein n=1 Tax=Passalora fulva TaxID=5499 RepID=A0A9Q8PCN9_PASFU|nr:uncharacterized protein CLAFUR5_09967 [Fulvia fulva]KAK4619630.1 hypothetical protein CLAFUR4_10930 [Fulvia fulva]KAK4620927.1 hypothetical protein CLAFUR0_10937 [Fulvia fulva]UJO20043.1 hypothetical protein CLAFUR5_09967 [Fulvia fulva]WPV16922.1 hypothetical protein CLAFUW4_10925 [Fulvia fulva]WPV31958.1 hypothetical protein CLAFUW7_10923 [Fulvia fulva]
MAAQGEPRAAGNVSAIPELLGMILLETDEVTLFVLQSVNSTFNAIITTSTAIQKRMCLVSTRLRTPVTFPRRQPHHPCHAPV